MGVGETSRLPIV